MERGQFYRKCFGQYNIESAHRHDFKFCKCGAVAVDGGKDYLRRCGNREEWEELSEYFDQRISST